LRTGDYPGLAEAIEAAVPKLGTRPRSMIACGAGPVVGRTLKLTNAPWMMDGPDAARRTGLKQGLLLNDFEAQALSLPTIPEVWERRIGLLRFGSEGPQVILGPGTGLGVAALVEADGRFTPVSSEACHIDFGPISEEEYALWPHLERAHGRITSESVISGAGLARVHRARIMAKGAPDPNVGPPAVTAAAVANPTGEEAKSLRLYWHIVARFAGDMAVTFVATGGVTLSGGVLPRVVDFLDEAAFRQAFEAKAPVDGLAKRIPTRLVTREDAVLVGMAAIASTPGRYGVDYASRAWV
jgi:glucokinase